MEKDRPTLCERCLQFGHPKSTAEFTRNYAKSVQSICRKEECTLWRELCLYCKKTRVMKICEEYKMEARIQSKMKLEKCDAYTAKKTLGYRKGENSTCHR